MIEQFKTIIASININRAFRLRTNQNLAFFVFRGVVAP
jgi:hypothetical protein